ncbi:hypothetical protein B7R74_20220 [Yersinia pseudotuberculosis]|uniref:ead/Ea22-like family protein n=1 Tax=Yersinia pseudotuberculosis TaxID=633 RepID=UPI000D0B647F|nr:ead/Ea22-like family protein [Yersinia pseudotuberculosis]PSH12523.1 hypothetical protein B7R74_20220 [Yersinia pseudotuberculosis]
MNNIEELKNAAMKATPGPWFGMDEDWSDGENIQITCESREGVIEIAKVEGGGSESGFSDPFKSEQQANAIFIALANPSALLDLIARLEAAQKELFDLHNQELQQRLANAEHQLYMKDLAIHNIKASRMAQFRKRLKAEAALSAANEKLLVPTGYCLMPKSLTAENGAKGALSGEFFTETDITCEECGGDCDEDDLCEHCNGLGFQTVRTAIGWSIIKDIYKMAAGATAIRQAGFTVDGE